MQYTLLSSALVAKNVLESVGGVDICNGVGDEHCISE